MRNKARLDLPSTKNISPLTKGEPLREKSSANALPATSNSQQNELAILEFIHLLVETMDRHFGNVYELDIMFHLEKAYFMREEIVMKGCQVETSKANILSPVQLMSKNSQVTLIVNPKS